MDLKLFWATFVLISCLTKSKADNGFNIMIISDEGSEMEAGPVEEALDFVQHHAPQGLNAHCVLRVDLENVADHQRLLSYLCEKHSEAVSGSCGPHLILDLTREGPQSDAVRSYCIAVGLPTVSIARTTPSDLRLDNSQLVQLFPPDEIIPEVINAISSFQQMTSAAIIYDHSFGSVMGTISLLEGLAVRHMMMDVDEFHRKKSRLRELDIINYFVLGSLSTIQHVLDSAQSLNNKFAWYAVTKDEGQLKCTCKNMTVVVVKPMSPRLNAKAVAHLSGSLPPILRSFFYDLTVRAVISLWSLVNETGEFNSSVQCLSKETSEGQDRDFRKHFMKPQQLYEPMYGPITLKENGSGQMEFHMSVEVVTPSRGIREVVGSWGGEGQLQVWGAHKLRRIRAKPVYRVVTVLQPPFLMMEKDENGNNNYTGYCINLMDEISQIVGFEYEVYTAPDNRLGNMDERGQWNGLIKEVFEKRADMGLSSLSVTAERQNVVEFTVPFYDLVGMNILMKKPKPSTSLFKFFDVMENDVWACILIIYFFTSLLIWMFDKFSLYISQGFGSQLKGWEAGEKREFTIKECLWFCMTSLTTQGGGGEAPSTISGRVIVATWWLFGFILTASYTANLAAFLTVSRLDIPIQSLEDLAGQYKVQYAVMNGSSGMTYFQRMADIEALFQRKWKELSLSENLTETERRELAVWDYPMRDKYHKMWTAMQEAGLPATLEDAVERVLASKSSEEGFAYIGDGTNVRYNAMTNCELQEIGEEICKLPLAIAVQKGSHLTDNLNNAINKLLHSKRLEQLKERWWDENPKRMTCSEHDGLAEGISNDNIGGVFALMSMGLFLACATLFFEYCRPK